MSVALNGFPVSNPFTALRIREAASAAICAVNAGMKRTQGTGGEAWGRVVEDSLAENGAVKIHDESYNETGCPL